MNTVTQKLHGLWTKNTPLHQVHVGGIKKMLPQLNRKLKLSMYNTKHPEIEDSMIELEEIEDSAGSMQKYSISVVITSTQQDANNLKSVQFSTKCCWEQIKNYVNGYGRIIVYENFAYSVMEGKLVNGEVEEFGRLIMA